VREIGVRVALGATTWDIVALVLRQGLRPVAVGIVVGLGVSAALSAFLTATLSSPAAPDFLFGIGAFDPATFGGLTVLLLMVAGLASAMPARLVAKVDPVVALRLS
jgi:ABC-type antimicrobial peptide transport system permease subunit